MTSHYTSERNVQIVIALMKSHGIRYVVASPGATNVTFVGSLQNKHPDFFNPGLEKQDKIFSFPLYITSLIVRYRSH